MSDIRAIDLNLLAALDALLDERNVSRAAERLSLTQPAVSGMLNRLRKALNDPLFVRASHGIVPTPRALALETPLKNLLRDAEALVAGERFDPATLERTFRIATNDYMQLVYVVPLVRALRKTAPRIRIALRHMTITGQAAELANGETDLAVTIPDFAAPDLTSRVLCKERYVGVAGPRRKIPAKLSLEEFCAREHVVVSPAGGGFVGPVDDALARIGRRRRVALSVPDFLLLPALLKECDLVAAVPERLTRAHPGAFKTFELPLKVPGFDVIAAWHARVHEDPAHKWLRDQLAAVVKATR